MDYIDNELFIEEIKKRPAIWNSHADDCGNNELIKEKWIEIFLIIIPDYVDKTDIEKEKIESDLRLKWGQMKDAFVEYVRWCLRKSSDQIAPVSTPVFYGQLKFLMPVVGPTDQTANDTEHCETIPVPELPDTQQPEPCTRSFADPKNKSLDVKENVTEFFAPKEWKRQKNVDRQNGDYYFYKSLLPFLQKLSEDQKMMFRIDAMKLVRNYTQTSPQNLQQQWNESNLRFYERSSMFCTPAPQMVPRVAPQMMTQQAYQMMPPQQAQQMMPQQAYQMIPQQAYQMIPQQVYQMMPPQAQQMMPQQAQQLIPQQAQQLIPQQAQQLIPQQAEQMMPQQAQQTMSHQAQQMMPQQAHQLMPQMSHKIIAETMNQKMVKPMVKQANRPDVPPSLVHFLRRPTSPRVIPARVDEDSSDDDDTPPPPPPFSPPPSQEAYSMPYLTPNYSESNDSDQN